MQKILTSTANGLVKSSTTSFLRVTSARLTTLVSLFLATILLAACGGGGSSGSSGGGASDPAGVTTDPAGNVARFPDDGAVSYTLNITRQNLASPIVSLNVTATITDGDCSISPAGVAPLTYGTNNQTTTSFDIAFTGTATVGDTCVVNFAVSESTNLGIQIRNLIRTVTFNAELAPTLVATLLGNATGDSTNVPGHQAVRVNVTATKQDGSNSRDVEFPAAIISSITSSCMATLAGSPTRQYDGTIAGTSSVSVIYNVRPTILGTIVNCGTFTFTSTEGSVAGMSPQFSDTISFVVEEIDTDSDGVFDFIDNCRKIVNPGQSDLNNDGEGDVCDTNSDDDTDGVVDADDVDADGDGLIELSTATELNMIRYNLGGTGLDDGNSDGDNTAGGNSAGCGNGVSITVCNGYEQMADIDLNNLTKDATGSNWEPVGTCGSGSACDGSTNAQFFTGVFSGNNFIISNLLINITTDRYGVGFFGAISSTSELRNVHIRGGNITRTEVTSQYVGGLLGWAPSATISNSSVTLAAISGTSQIGGLAGRAVLVIISSSVATVGSISGSGNSVGGLIGWGSSAIMSSSVAIIGSINSNDNNVGGLVGQGNGATISSSVATVGSINSNDNNVGGLIGSGSSATIISAVATVGSISGVQGVGGLIGDSFDATISLSVAVTNSITGTIHAGGLVGYSGSSFLNPTSVTYSYWDAKLSFANAAQLSSNTFGSSQTTAALQTPVVTNSDGSFPAGIYAEWANAYCNPNTGEYRATAPNPLGDFIRVWDLGTNSQYPAITCAQRLLPLDIQREAARRALAGELPLAD